jgi:UPF0716 protein FxsA
MAKLFLLFLIVPLVEIYFLIEVGDVIGAGFTVFMVVLTALIGAALVRYQGFTTLARAQAEMLNSRMPALEVIEGAMLLLAGALLFIPGFVTDTLGFLLLIPPLRQSMALRFLKKRVVRAPDARIYDGEARDADERIMDIEYKDRD